MPYILYVYYSIKKKRTVQCTLAKKNLSINRPGSSAPEPVPEDFESRLARMAIQDQHVQNMPKAHEVTSITLW